MKTLLEIRTEPVAENLDLALIGVRRGPEHEEWEASIGDLFRATEIRDGVFSVSKAFHRGGIGFILIFHLCQG